MRFFLAIFMGLLVTVSPAAGAVDDIDKILQTGIRCDHVTWYFYLNVTGKTTNGATKYYEVDIRDINKNISLCSTNEFINNYEKYTAYNFYIIDQSDGKNYIIGEMQFLDPLHDHYGPIYNVRLNIRWKFNLKKQCFELDYNKNEMPVLDDKSIQKFDRKDELKARALQGDEGAIAILKDRDLWN